MKNVLRKVTVFVALGSLLVTAPAFAAGKLFIYNWTDYTSPELVKKFEAETGISVTIDTYDSNETLLAKLQSGAKGYDIAIPSHNFVPILISEGLLEPINAKQLKGFENVDADFANPEWDSNNRYSIPWQWGTTAYTVNTRIFTGDIHTYDVLFHPPAELRGKIGMFKSPDDAVSMALLYLGLPLCSENPSDMQQVLELLQAQKPHVKIYSTDGTLERLISGDIAIHMNWSGYSMRARSENPVLKYGFPREGVIAWVDNVVVPKGAPNYANAIKFIEFLMKPENIAIESDFAGYANGIVGSLPYMKDELKNAEELTVPKGTPLVFSQTCSPKAIDLQNRVWTTLLK